MLPKGLFDEVVTQGKKRAAKQPKKRRFTDDACTIMLIAQLAEDTAIAEGYFDCILLGLKVEVLSTVNVGCGLSANNILGSIARLPKHMVATGCFNNLFHSIQNKAMKQLKAGCVRNTLNTLAVLHEMPETALVLEGCFDNLLLKLQTVLRKSIAAYNNVEQISSFIGCSPPQLLRSCVDMTLTVQSQLLNAIEAGHTDREEFVYSLVV